MPDPTRTTSSRRIQGNVLPLYPQRPALAVETTPPRALDPSCRGCSRHEGAARVCMAPEVMAPWKAESARPATVLVVGGWPAPIEDKGGRTFFTDSGKMVRGVLQRNAPAARIILDVSVRCGSAKTPTPSEVDACRPHLAAVIAEHAPDRILAIGEAAVQALTGRRLSLSDLRRAYTYTDEGVPVFFVMAPALAMRNRFLRRWFEEDVRWALTANPPAARFHGRALLVRTAQEAAHAVARIKQAPRAAFDVESAGLRYHHSFRLLSVAVTPEGSDDAYVWAEEGLADPAARRVLAEYLGDETAEKGGHGVRFDMTAAHCALGVMPRGVKFDTLLRRALLDPEALARLGYVAELVGYGGHKGEADDIREARTSEVRKLLAAEARWTRRVEAERQGQTFRTKRPPLPPPVVTLGLDSSLEELARRKDIEEESWNYALLPQDVLCRYNGRDAVVTMRAEERLSREIDAAGLGHVWGAIVQDAGAAVAQVEAWGVHVDQQALAVFDQFLDHKTRECKQALDVMAPGVLWTSPEQVAEFLYGKLKLPITTRTETGQPSTDAKTLEKMADRHPSIGMLRQLRKFEKMRTNYAGGLAAYIMDDGRVHPYIDLTGAATGRTSCKDPPLQTIPSEKRDPAGGPYLGRMARNVYSAAAGCQLVSLDYSQIELRVAAILSGDPLMRDIFTSGEDYHLRTAKMVSRLAWGIPPEEVTTLHRTAAKNINFGILYGKTAHTFAKEFGCTVEQAQQILDAVLGSFEQLKDWCEARLSEVRRTGLVWTAWDGKPARRRSLDDAGLQGDDKTDSHRRSTAEHGAVNTPVQGTASDYLLRSMVRLVDWIQSERVPAKLVLPVHDAMLLEVPRAHVQRVAFEARRIMLDYDTRGVPLAVDVEVGDAWGILEKVKLAA